MATFMSGTDIGELVDSAPLHNCFVSLVVNNAGVYTVALSSVGKSTAVIETKESMSFTDFDGSTLEFEDIVTTKTVSTDAAYYCYGDITKEECPVDSLGYLSVQLNSIRKEKAKATPFRTSQDYTKRLESIAPKGYSAYGDFPKSVEKPYSEKYGLSDADSRRFGGYVEPKPAPLWGKTAIPEIVKEEDRFCNMILTLGLFSDMVKDTDKFLDDISREDEIMYNIYLPDILHIALEVVYDGNEEKGLAALKYAKAHFTKYIYDTTAKEIVEIINAEITELEETIKESKTEIIKPS